MVTYVSNAQVDTTTINNSTNANKLILFAETITKIMDGVLIATKALLFMMESARLPVWCRLLIV